MTTTTAPHPTCGRPIAALVGETRTIRPCVKYAGHPGVCNYAAQQRPTEDVCPAWCAGHRDAYQSWEDTGEAGAQTRNHAAREVEVGGTLVSVGVCSVEDQDHALSPAVVELYSGIDRADLTPAQP